MELLIAVTLLSLVTVGLLFALRVGLTAFGKTQSHLMDNRRVAGAQRILEAEIEGLIPILVPCGGGNAPFFQGQPDRMRLISTFSLQEAWRGQPQILELFVMPGDNGGMRLMVNESPYVHPNQAGRSCAGVPIAPGPKSFVLADKLAFCRFTYLNQPENILEHPVWGQMFVGRVWPAAVRIQMAPMEPDFSRLQPITVTAPLRIYRLPEFPYVDQ